MGKKKLGIGLLTRLILGVFIPILIAFFLIWALIFYGLDFGGVRIESLKRIGEESVRDLSRISSNEAKFALNRLGEKMIKEKAIDVATQMEIFIKSHPKMKRDDLLKDPWLKSIAVQKVGETGYTAVHDNRGINYFHVNPQIVGMDLHELAPKLPAFWKILEASLKGPAWGYYDWKDADGKIRPKYMYLTPVRDTDLIVAATTYIDEFSKPAKALEIRMKSIESRYLETYELKIQLFYLIIIGVLVILLMVIFFYSRSIIRPIRQLSEVADKISMGELDTPIQIKASGEIGGLVESIERMQTSVKAAIERLQKRK
jgi:HAMP domain-containing protein